MRVSERRRVGHSQLASLPVTQDPYGNNQYDPYGGERPQEYSLDPGYNTPQSPQPEGYHQDPQGGGYYEQPGQYDPRQYTAVPYGVPGHGDPAPQNGFGVAALVLGISTIAVSWCCYLMVLGAPAGILAIIFGALGVQKANRGEANNRGTAMAGLVCGIVGLALSVLILVLLVVLGTVDGYLT